MGRNGKRFCYCQLVLAGGTWEVVMAGQSPEPGQHTLAMVGSGAQPDQAGHWWWPWRGRAGAGCRCPAGFAGCLGAV